LNDETHSKQKQNLLVLRSKIAADFPNLLALKQYIIGVKNQIIDVLVTLNEEELAGLEDVSTPSFCDNILHVANICRQIPLATSLPNRYKRGVALRDISTALAAAGDIDRALEVANSIPNWLFYRAFCPILALYRLSF
jgi:hypothetical protein